MKICPNCNAELADGALFCENCGKQLTDPTVCPFCGKPLNAGAKFCSNCGKSIGNEPEPQKKSYVGWIVAAVILVLLIAGGGTYYYLDQQKKAEAKLQEEQRLRELAVKDSLEEVQYQEQMRIQQAAEAEQARKDEIRAFITSIYSYREQYMDKVKRYYSVSLLNAYNSWVAPEGLEGPMPLFFEKKWDDGCGSFCETRNFKSSISDINASEETTATVTATASFDVYSAYDDQPFMESVSHSDVFKLVHEGGEWKIDDLIRDGSSMKEKYRGSSPNCGRAMC